MGWESDECRSGLKQSWWCVRYWSGGENPWVSPLFLHHVHLYTLSCIILYNIYCGCTCVVHCSVHLHGEATDIENVTWYTDRLSTKLPILVSLHIIGNSLQTFARLLMSIEDCRQNMVGGPPYLTFDPFPILNTLIIICSHSWAQFQWGCYKLWRTSGKSRFKRQERKRRSLTEPLISTTENCRITWPSIPRRETYWRYDYCLT